MSDRECVGLFRLVGIIALIGSMVGYLSFTHKYFNRTALITSVLCLSVSVFLNSGFTYSVFSLLLLLALPLCGAPVSYLVQHNVLRKTECKYGKSGIILSFGIFSGYRHL